MKIPASFSTAILFSFTLAASTAVTAAPNSDLEIAKVQADASSTQITISIVDQDDKLRGLPGVSLAGNPLVIVSATVNPGRRPSTATIVAKLPAGVAAATYELVVDWGHDSTINTEITLGVQGAQGPQGIPGANGVPGAQGPVGPQGPAGPQGATGAQGAAGATGPKGDPGAGAVVADVGSGGACGSVGGSSITDGAGHTSVVCDGLPGQKGDPGTSAAFTTPLGALSAIVLNGSTGLVGGEEQRCPDGEVGVALNIGLDSSVGVLSDLVELGLTCGSVTVQNGFLGPFGVISNRSNTANLGSGAITNATSACPLGMVMIGLVGTGDGVSTAGGIDNPFSIGARCASVGGATVNGPVFGKSGGTDGFDIECPQGKVVTGVQGTPDGTKPIAQVFGVVCQ